MRIDRQECMEKCGARAAFAGSEHRLFDFFFGNRIALEILEELEAVRQQPEADTLRSALAGVVEADTAKMIDGKAESIGQRLIAKIAEPGFLPSSFQQIVGV